ncbi:MAG: UvrB/UvrC motif-containing protein, partial [Bacillota bacterium]|nr:UvrB/UvrC motif-containing protein [Bacillota bacterium]
ERFVVRPFPKKAPEVKAAYIKKLEREMHEAARRLEFERAAQLRDEIRCLRAELAQVG